MEIDQLVLARLSLNAVEAAPVAAKRSYRCRWYSRHAVVTGTIRLLSRKGGKNPIRGYGSITYARGVDIYPWNEV